MTESRGESLFLPCAGLDAAYRRNNIGLSIQAALNVRHHDTYYRGDTAWLGAAESMIET